MAVTISHQSALDVVRALRADGQCLEKMDAVSPVSPTPWAGKHWGKVNFTPDVWRWGQPNAHHPLHVLAPSGLGRVRSNVVKAHAITRSLPPGSVLWLDENSSIVCPELLFLQMSRTFSLPMLVLLGYELCGHFARSPEDPLGGRITDGLPAATSVERIRDYLSIFKGARGIARAKYALSFVGDHAISAPEAVLATMLSLPTSEAGYGMGPVLLNTRVNVGTEGSWVAAKKRFPDLMLLFAPVGMNYDGEEHLDLSGLVLTAQAAALADPDSSAEKQAKLLEKLQEVRAKVVDDNMRNRQLAAAGQIVFPVTKEDLYGEGHLDYLVRQVLDCARQVFGVDTGGFEVALEDTDSKRDRQELLNSMLAQGRSGRSSYGIA